MKKLGCAKCGGVKKMKVGGSAVAKAPVNMYGIPQENMGTSSQMGFGKKGGTLKEHPITAFRKANEARDVVVKASMKKMQAGGTKVRRSADDYKDEAMYAKKRKDLIDKDPNVNSKLYSIYSDKIDSLAREGFKKQIKAGFVPKVLQEAQKDIREKREKRKAYKK